MTNARDRAGSLTIPVQDGELVYWPNLFNDAESNQLFFALLETVQWTSRTIKLYGRTIIMPRRVAWYAEPGVRYAYSGGEEPRNDWTAQLLSIKQCVEKAANIHFNGALLNLYRNGADTMGWHSDDEPSLGRNPVIASVSLGATRRFRLQHKKNKALTIALDLNPGSLLIMRGETQHYWRHQLPRTRQSVGARINITFRRIHVV